MKDRLIVERYRTRSGRWLWKVGKANWSQNMLLDDAGLADLGELINEARGAMTNEYNSE